MSTMNENGKLGNLFERFDPCRLRTVSNFHAMPPGACDIKIEIELKDESCSKLSFPAPWDGKFYCYYRTGKHKNDEKWFINDWGSGKCLLLQEVGQTQSHTEFVKTDDVLRMLEECIRIPAQRAMKINNEVNVNVQM